MSEEKTINSEMEKKPSASRAKSIPAGRARRAELHGGAKQKVAKKPKQVAQVRESRRVAQRKVEIAIPECPCAIAAHHDPNAGPQDLGKTRIVGQRIPQGKHAKPVEEEAHPVPWNPRANSAAEENEWGINNEKAREVRRNVISAIAQSVNIPRE